MNLNIYILINDASIKKCATQNILVVKKIKKLLCEKGNC